MKLCCLDRGSLGEGSGDRLGQFGHMGEGELHQRMAAADIKLFRDVPPVGNHSVVADVQFVCDLFAGFVLGDELKDALLGASQVLQAGLGTPRIAALAPAKQIPGQRRADVVLAGRDGPDSIYDFGGNALFQDVSFSPQRHRFLKQSLLPVGGEEDQVYRNSFFDDLAGYRESIKPGHADVDQGEIGAQSLNQCECRRSIACLAHNL